MSTDESDMRTPWPKLKYDRIDFSFQLFLIVESAAIKQMESKAQLWVLFHI